MEARDSNDRVMAEPLSAVGVREGLVHALELDLVGPPGGDALAEETLPQAPSRWYLTGFLVPLEAKEEQRSDETSRESLDLFAPQQNGTDDAAPPEPDTAKRAFFPSSMGLSVLVPSSAHQLTVTVRWGDYEPADETNEVSGAEPSPPGANAKGVAPQQTPTRWKRNPREEKTQVQIAGKASRSRESDLPNSNGLKITVSIRLVPSNERTALGLPEGARSVSVFLVNRRRPADDLQKDRAFTFQAELEVSSEVPFVARPNLRSLDSDDWDERVADLQYRDAFEFAVGHGVATKAAVAVDGSCRSIRTCWIPSAEVEAIDSVPLEGVEFSMESLAKLESESQTHDCLDPLISLYRSWLDRQAESIPSIPVSRRETAEDLIRRARIAADRIEAGIRSLGDPQVLQAFRLANRAMAAAARRRQAKLEEKDPAAVDPPAWRPFQLAFVLMNLAGIVDPQNVDREVVDLLFFPTGGGKTEAYLGLAAFTLVLRRLRNPGILSAGLTVLMRYTLRLLTLDQLSRAAALICALELERQQDPADLGEWPFEIGLWVGQAATPNRMGKKGDNDQHSARSKTIAFQNDDRKPSPIPLEECPWCGTKFTRNSFHLEPNSETPTDLRITCVNRRCDFTGNRSLPILGIDEPIYRRLPCFLVATVDKFALMPWVGRVGTLFGKVDRYDQTGFYGPCDPGRGSRLPSPLLPPELVIQDELHLISGPMGTMVGLYEAAIDELCTTTTAENRTRPKIVASTATVRRAQQQIRALFGRADTHIFPPPLLNLRNSFFARMRSTDERNPRLYIGVAANARSPKVILLRTYLALLGAAQKAFEAAGGTRNDQNPADPYMTIVGYFNSLRELGGSRRIVEDEVRSRVAAYSKRRRVGERDGFFADREIDYEVVELTSRVSTADIAVARRRLASSFSKKGERIDVALATNMISVGIDIARLGLMVVFGQPKTTAEYIQATSRVGRDPSKPGLIVTLLNIHKPRDRSHYERFSAYHESFYRSVEATSVTPFSARALDRGLAGALVALARLDTPELTPPLGAAAVAANLQRLERITTYFADRARDHASMPSSDADIFAQRTSLRVAGLLDLWARIASDYDKDGTRLQYQLEEGAAKPLLHDFLDPELALLPDRFLKFRANRSLRDVEPNVNLWVKTSAEAAADDDEDNA